MDRGSLTLLAIVRAEEVDYLWIKEGQVGPLHGENFEKAGQRRGVLDSLLRAVMASPTGYLTKTPDGVWVASVSPYSREEGGRR